MVWRVDARQVEVWQALPCNTTNTTPTQSEGPASGIQKTALNTETSFLQHTDNNFSCHPDIFAFPCANTYTKEEKFYQAPNGRVDIVKLRFHDEIDAFHVFLGSEHETVSRLTKRELLQFVTPIPPHWPSIFC